MAGHPADGGQRRGARRRGLVTLIGVLVLALGITAALSVGAAAKKNGTSKAKTFSGQVSPNLAIPDAAAGAVSTPVTSTINVGKKFKGKAVGDVNVTGFQTTGSAAGAANDLVARLTAPNGRTTLIVRNAGDQSLGPWTLDDDSKTQICDQATPPCADGLQTLNRPFAGTSNLINVGSTLQPLAAFNGVGMRGVWTLTVADISVAAPTDGTSVLNHWGLQITRAQPVRP